MKTIITCLVLLMSVSAMSAEIVDCQIDGVTVKNVVVPSAQATSSIQAVLDSDKEMAVKKQTIRSLIFIDSVSIGDGDSLCELATTQYKVTNEKCSKVVGSRDLAESVIDSDDLDATLECKIGVSAQMLMQFNL